MELRITNPQENWLTEQILWNNEELKAAIAEKVKDYKTIAYTEDSLKDMKADRADLNKLKKSFRGRTEACQEDLHGAVHQV